MKRRYNRVNCKYCGKDIANTNIKKHESACYLNPLNIKKCVVCEKPIKGFRTNIQLTCSRSCANTHFRSGEDHPNWKDAKYRSTCFIHHEKKCIICGEDKIVAVHHNDHDRTNNNPENLIPMCPTHHFYVHSRYKDEVQPKIDEYIKQWKEKQLT